jgi:hypothetical protein
MSTYYYLACDKCKEAIAVASWSVSGKGPMGGTDMVPEWVIEHHGHPVRVVSEHDGTIDAYARPDLDEGRRRG